MSTASLANRRTSMIIMRNPLEKKGSNNQMVPPAAPASTSGKLKPAAASPVPPKKEEISDEFTKKDLNFENLSDAVPIEYDTVIALTKKYEQHFENNQNAKILEDLEKDKLPYLFGSDDLLKLIQVTTSVKTKIAIINLIAPRLTDPRAKMEHMIGLFRYAEEKSSVEEALKARITTLNGSAFRTNSSPLPAPTSTTAGGRGAGAGRGRTGAGRGEAFRPSRVQSLPSNFDTTELKEMVKEAEAKKAEEEKAAADAEAENSESAAPRPAINLRAAFGKIGKQASAATVLDYGMYN